MVGGFLSHRPFCVNTKNGGDFVNDEKIATLSEKARRLTDLPGVYLMKNKQDEIIYVGKAKNLKKRVSSYFRSVANHTPKVYKMVWVCTHFWQKNLALPFNAEKFWTV